MPMHGLFSGATRFRPDRCAGGISDTNCILHTLIYVSILHKAFLQKHVKFCTMFYLNIVFNKGKNNSKIGQRLAEGADACATVLP